MFLKKSKDTSKLIDNVFNISLLANKAKKDGKEIINATLGSLYDENNTLVTLKSFYNSYKNLDNITLAKYSSSITGNIEYKNTIKEFVLEDKFKNLKAKVIATSGGTGAIYLAINNLLDPYQKIIIPDIGWTNYETIAKENNLSIIKYQMFDEDNNFNLKSLKEKIIDSLSTQNKALLIINSPLHNPTGYTIKEKDIKELVRFINNDCNNKEVIILNDIAYIDYSFNLNTAKNYFSILDTLNSNALLVLTYSCSKTFTAYGMRLGALIFLHKEESILEYLFNAFNKSCRSIYSNINNGAMMNVVNVLLNHKKEFLEEKDYYINLLKKRASIFIKEAKDNNLDLYPYDEGFFITLKINSNNLDKYHNILLKNNIYTIKVHNGIRIALCSLSLKDSLKLPKILKELLNKVKD